MQSLRRGYAVSLTYIPRLDTGEIKVIINAI